MRSILAAAPAARRSSRYRVALVPYWRTVLGLFVVYSLYLPFSGYRSLHFDALGYWFISIFFHKQGSFSLFNYHDSLRGYLLPLLLLPARVVQYYTELPILVFARLLGAVSAAVGFGWIVPHAWAAATGQTEPLSWRRRAVFAALGFVFWRDYFNFTLSDFPAVWALAAAVWLLCRPTGKVYSALLAGVCLAAATNFRPVYLAAVPFAGALALVGTAGRTKSWRLRRGASLVAGMALIMLPQLVINLRHFQSPTPLVLARDKDVDKLYLMQLHLGLDFQKYETNVGTDYASARVFFLDPAGQRLLDTFPHREIPSYEQYVRRLVLQRPLDMAGVYVRHLFNGLDLQYPTPYVQRVYGSSVGLAFLNYSLWFAALLLALRSGRPTWRSGLALAAVLAPCAAVLPVCIECRYLLPLHLLVCAAVSFGWPAKTQLPARWPPRLALAAAYLAFVSLCFWASAGAQATLELGARNLW